MKVLMTMSKLTKSLVRILFFVSAGYASVPSDEPEIHFDSGQLRWTNIIIVKNGCDEFHWLLNNALLAKADSSRATNNFTH